MTDRTSFFLTSIHLIAIACLSCIVPGTLGDGETTIQEKGLRYIQYNGSVSGTFAPNDTGCTTWTIGPQSTFDLLVGVAGPWDTNPFWFGFAGPENFFVDNVDDGVASISFESADLLCYEDSGRLCTSFEFDIGGADWYFVGKELLNLNRTTIQKIAIDGVDGYQVIGNETSYAGDDTVQNLVIVGGNASNCTTESGNEQYTLGWTETTPFTYQLAFTNNTASLDLTLSTIWGFLVLNYTGKRTDSGAPSNETVVLNTTNPTKPVFTYVNGSTFEWYNITGHGYGVTAGSMAALSPRWSNEKWTWCVFVVTMVFVTRA
ncbi:hypothetical protein VTN96DRAFT_5526 [Rasamsonia emersonii]